MTSIPVISCATRPSSRSWSVVPISAASNTALERAKENVIQRLDAWSQASPAQVAYDLQREVDPFPYRRAYLLNQSDADGASLNMQRNQFVDGIASPALRPVVFVFSGVGEQYARMAEELYRKEPVFARRLEECAELLKAVDGFDLIATLYPAGRSQRAKPARSKEGSIDLRALLGRIAQQDSEDDGLSATASAHPALFAIEYSLARLWMSWGVVPAAMTGHSLGEYTAACIAGVMSLADAIKVVVARARLIGALPHGAMLGVAIPAAQLETMLTADISIAAINAGSMCVAAGPADKIGALRARLHERGIANSLVKATHAFHSRMLQPIRHELENIFRGIRLHAPEIPYISNRTGSWISSAEATSPEYWAGHTCEMVRFADGIATLDSSGFNAYLEIGPGQVLGGFIQQHVARDPVAVFHSLPGAYDNDSADFLMTRAIASLWCLGALADWRSYSEEPAAGEVGGNRACPGGAASALSAAPVEPPIGEAEVMLANLWRDILNVPEVGRHDDFFLLGGGSLLAMRVMARVRHELGVALPIGVLFQYRTPAALAAVLEEMLIAEIEGITEDEVNEQVRRLDAANAGAEGPTPAAHALPNGLRVWQFNRPETDHFYHDIFETRVYARHGISLPAGAVVFDIGANIGLFSLFVFENCKNAKVYAFEPAPPVFELLKQNIESVGGCAEVFNIGLADKAGRLSLTFYPRSTGMSSFDANETEEREVLTAIMQNQLDHGMAGMGEIMSAAGEVLDMRFRSKEFDCEILTVSEIIRRSKIERIDLMKIDVQKTEHLVLAGVEDGHWPLIRQIVVEVHDIGGRVGEISALLEARGFRVVVVQDELYQGSNISNLYAVRH